jgi:hypothetical protein
MFRLMFVIFLSVFAIACGARGYRDVAPVSPRNLTTFINGFNLACPVDDDGSLTIGFKNNRTVVFDVSDDICHDAELYNAAEAQGKLQGVAAQEKK